MSLSDVLARPKRAMHSTVASSSASRAGSGAPGSCRASNGSAITSASAPRVTVAKLSRFLCIGARLLLVQSRRLPGLMVAFGQVLGVAGGLGVEAGGQLEVAIPLVEIRGDCVPTRDTLIDLSQCRQPGRRAGGLAHRDCSVEPYDRRVGEPQQLVVPLHDLDPVGVLHA